MVMLDHQTGSYWMQVSGEAIVGTLTGERLTALPSQTTTWELWLAQFPETLVLSRSTGFNRDYTYDPFTGLGERFNETGEFIFPVSETGRDPRLDPGEVVLGVEIGDAQRAYPIERLGEAVINETIGETPLVIFSVTEGPTGAAFSSKVAGDVLTFSLVNGAFTDDQTGSVWNLAGVATEGELAGTQLTALPTRSTFWFSLITSFPELTVYTGE